MDQTNVSRAYEAPQERQKGGDVYFTLTVTLTVLLAFTAAVMIVIAILLGTGVIPAAVWSVVLLSVFGVLFLALGGWFIVILKKTHKIMLGIARAVAERGETVYLNLTKQEKRALHIANNIRESVFDVVLGVLNVVLLFLGVFLIILPLLNYFSLAFNDGNFNLGIVFWPNRISFYPFRYIFAGEGALNFWRSFLNSVLITLIITVVSNLVEAMAAYVLSKKDCPFRSGIMLFFIITMLFSAGIVPIQQLMRMFHLNNTLWSVVFISISNVTHLLYFKTFFEGIPSDIEEAARLDGASELQLFMLVIVPMSLPIIGSCCFFTVVGTWNSYGTALLFITESPTYVSVMPLAYYIYYFMNRSSTDYSDPVFSMNYANVQAAMMLLSIIPILMLYPYIVRYIKSGLQIGSVKG